MRPLDLRAELSGNPRITKLVRDLFARLGRGDWQGASEWLSDPIDLFGRSVTREQWSQGSDHSIAGDVETLAELPPTIPFSADEQRQLFGGALANQDRVCFATVRVGDQETRVTYGLVIDLSTPTTPRLSRLFDPGPFKDFSEAQSPPRGPSPGSSAQR